jgi:hypothetical protein
MLIANLSSLNTKVTGGLFKRHDMCDGSVEGHSEF